MSRWIFALVVVIGGLSLVLYQLFVGRDPVTIPVPLWDAAPVQTVGPSDAAPYKPRPRGIDARTVAESAQLDDQSEEFSRAVDVTIPDRFRASLAGCNRKGFDPDAKISFSYTLTIREGVVSASNVKIEKSDLGDSALENCMLGAIQGARWTDPELPDFSEDQDLFLRIRSLNKYLDEDEQRRAKAAENTEND